MASIVHEARAEQPANEGMVIIRPEPEGAKVERVAEGEYRIIGKQVERVVALNDVTQPEALAYIDERLKRLGVARLLSRAGATDGDVVHIGKFSFDYVPES
jgi:GTP-binding protein